MPTDREAGRETKIGIQTCGDSYTERQKDRKQPQSIKELGWKKNGLGEEKGVGVRGRAGGIKEPMNR